MKSHDIQHWITTTDPRALGNLYRRADDCRRRFVGDAVHLRGLLNFANICRRNCWYCGLRAERTDLPRYRMSQADILTCARRVEQLGYGTIVLQSGEDHSMDPVWIGEIVRRIKGETGLAVTLSLGERHPLELEVWKRAGADRYLLKFETSNHDLYCRYHPALAGFGGNRLGILAWLRDLGYEIGTGFMVGLPGQTPADLRRDLEMLDMLQPDMIGVGPFIPHPATPLARILADMPARPIDQVPASTGMTLTVLALVRLLCPTANIPATTALGTVDPAYGYESGLTCGANVIMPDVTPRAYREKYEIYPRPLPPSEEDGEADHRRLMDRIRSLGRSVGRGPGAAVSFGHHRGEKNHETSRA
ncbi:MAG: [FeFe] hydrogenase H-cluster radical SAM maturase HydE [Acidobacteria bacterium]|nr:[FeFe] hydrogenase H-cluster radical SAM maturase HydE [Acidobacteriota bacterium]